MSFDDLIGTEGLSRDEEATLRRVHELLVAAGPPPDLSPDLTLPPVPTEEADPPEVAFLLRRRRGRALVLALAATLAAFVGGYAFGHSKGKPAAFTSVRTVAMHGTAGTRVTRRHQHRREGLGRQLADARRGERAAGADEPRRVLRALAHAQRQGGRAVRIVPRPREDDARPAVGAVLAEELRRLGRDGAAVRTPTGSARSS